MTKSERAVIESAQAALDGLPLLIVDMGADPIYEPDELDRQREDAIEMHRQMAGICTDPVCTAPIINGVALCHHQQTSMET